MKGIVFTPIYNGLKKDVPMNTFVGKPVKK